MPWDQFLGNRPNKPQSPNDVASRPLPKSPVGSSLDGVVPQMIIRSPRVRPGKFLFSDTKRLLQQYPPQNRRRRNAHGGRLGGLSGFNSKILRTNQAHRSAGKMLQIFDHPPPSA